METRSNGAVRPCCAAKTHYRLITQTETLDTYRCEAPQEDGHPCGRRHFVAHLIGLDTRAAGAALGGS